MNAVKTEYFCTDNQFFAPLYFCLCVNYGFSDKAPDPAGALWQGLVSLLKRYITNKPQLDYIIGQIDNGALTSHMKGSRYPNGQHLISLIKGIKSRKNADMKSRALLEKRSPTADKNFINKIKNSASEKPKGYFSDFDPERLKIEGRSYLDQFINRKSNTKT